MRITVVATGFTKDGANKDSAKATKAEAQKAAGPEDFLDGLF